MHKSNAKMHQTKPTSYEIRKEKENIFRSFYKIHSKSVSNIKSTNRIAIEYLQSDWLHDKLKQHDYFSNYDFYRWFHLVFYFISKVQLKYSNTQGMNWKQTKEHQSYYRKIKQLVFFQREEKIIRLIEFSTALNAGR